MFLDCFSSAFRVNNEFKFPILNQTNINRTGVFQYTFGLSLLACAHTQTRTAESIINGNPIPNTRRNTFERSTCFIDLESLPANWR